MIAFDTNLLVRLLTNDDENQAARVAAVLDERTAFIPLSVLLETEWVLRSVYELTPAAVVSAFRTLLGLASVQAEATSRAMHALAWYEQGFDFADALHLATAVEVGADALATFDGKFRRLAAKHSALDVIEP